MDRVRYARGAQSQGLTGCSMHTTIPPTMPTETITLYFNPR